MDKNIQKLIEVSNYYGQGNDFVIAGGGNTSYKNDTRIWVKGSGTRLGDITEEGFVEIDREKLKAIANAQFSEDSTEREEQVKQALLAARIYPDRNQRPSVETSLHELLEGAFVVHTHPHLINGLLCSEQSKEKSKELFGDRVLYVPYIDPGYILFKAIQQASEDYRVRVGKAPNIILLENHGIFVDANTVDGIHETYDYVINTLKGAMTRSIRMDPVEVSTEYSEPLLAKVQTALNTNAAFRTHSLIQHFCASPETFAKVAYAFTPDIIVYCKSRPLFIPYQADVADMARVMLEQVEAYTREFGYSPKVLLLERIGMIALENNPKSLELVLDVYEDAMKIAYLSEDFGGSHFMNDRERAFIENWEVESYRQKIAQG